MSKILLVFGSNGALGRGVSEVLLKKDYAEFHLFDIAFSKSASGATLHHHEVQDLRIKENVSDAFKGLKPNANDEYFLFSTIGGYSGGQGLEKTQASEMLNMMNLNYSANFWILQEFSKLVQKAKGGSICFTGALTGIEPGMGVAAYGSAKAALLYLVEAAAIEGREYNMSVNAIAPYIIDTPANETWIREAGIEQQTLMKPTEIGELIDNLFRNYRFVSGNTIKLRFRFPKL